MATLTDPLYGDQWHFPLIGDIETIWGEYTGAGVHVGVYDDGVEYTHPDLAGNYDSSLHFQNGGITYDPAPILPSDGHGTSVAGLIGAVANNGIGGVGVAYGAMLTGVNILGDSAFLNEPLTLAAMDWARNFDIMSNSWGYTPLYGSQRSLANGFSQAAGENAEYSDVVTFGRGGLGTVIVQASGNDTRSANGDGLNASRYTITVAATDSSGDVTDYSNYGAAILVAAPAASVTTDRTGNNGYEAGDYTTTFGGTSAATPVTSGVVALMLEANGGLGWRDVQNILAISAAQTGSAYGSGASGFELDDWGSNTATNWNGGGMTFHGNYGFGMVDAYAAVRMAEVWNTLYDEAATSANEETTSVSYTGAPLAIPSLGQVDVALNVTQDIRIEDIYVTVDMQHSYSNDLILTLIGPNGEEIPLMVHDGGSSLMDGGFSWTFGITAALGMMSAGTWTLRILDDAAGDSGTISDVTLEFFGSEASTDDVHHFTQDLFDLVGVEASRNTISDTNGGTDWLNFAAMGSINVTVRLDNRTVAFSSDPMTLSISAASQIENVVTGDGNDTVVGNELNNEILGMRGNDSLSGGIGEDTLRGGIGGDSLFGGGQNDAMFGDDGNDALFGEGGRDSLRGGAGEDTLSGGWFNDWLYGEADNDSLDGEGGHDRLFGGGGEDTLRGGDGGDTLFGAAQNDAMFGDDGNDALFGEGGRDSLRGGTGNDTLSGGWFNDWLYGEDDNDLLNGDGGHDRLFGGLGADTLNGGDGGDTLFGANQDDMLFGGTGNDSLFGEGGRDTLDGGTGNDTMTGGWFSDVFAFADGFGADVITDFDANNLNERIDLSGVTAITDLMDLVSNHMTQVGSDVVITDGSNTITIEGVSLAEMSDGDDFLF